jgi:hypothetical protein
VRTDRDSFPLPGKPMETNEMRTASLMLPAAALLALAGCAGEPATQCTSTPQGEWQDADAFQQTLLARGFEINEFKVTEGNCYEIYGFDADGTKVEIYFDPVDGSVVKREED